MQRQNIFHFPSVVKNMSLGAAFERNQNTEAICPRFAKIKKKTAEREKELEIACQVGDV